MTTAVHTAGITNVLLYDADCAFCQRTAMLAPRLGLAARVAASQDVDLLAAGVDPDRALVEVPFVTAAGEVLYGHKAIAAALRTGGPLWVAVGRFMVGSPQSNAFARIYSWVARNRHRLPGGTPACAMDSELSGVHRSVTPVHSQTPEESRGTA